VASYLRDAILSGDIGPGQWIRQENVAERFGTSRLPVREALRLLEAEGLVEHEAHRGARVPMLSAEEVDVIFQIRERLEPLALSESLRHLSEDNLLRLDGLQKDIEASAGIEEFLALDREFHLLSYAGCRVERLTTMVTRLWNASQHYRRAFMLLSGPRRRWIAEAEHALLLDAIHRKDGVDAERLLSGHLRRTRVELSRHPEVFGP